MVEGLSWREIREVLSQDGYDYDETALRKEKERALNKLRRIYYSIKTQQLQPQTDQCYSKRSFLDSTSEIANYTELLCVSPATSHVTFLQRVKDLGAEIYKERLRQTRYSFNLAILMTVVSTALILVGCGLIFSGKNQEGFVSAVGGVVMSSCSLRLAKDANDRLDKYLNEYEEEEDKTEEMKIASYLSQLNS